MALHREPRSDEFSTDEEFESAVTSYWQEVDGQIEANLEASYDERHRR